MRKPYGIIVFGANGSGKTTLGRELARILDFKPMDHEDYAFKPSEIPYTNPRSGEECIELMLSDIKTCRGFVISAVTGDFGDEIAALYDLAVYITAPLGLRIERIAQREYKKHGDRVLEGGDLYASRQRFIDFVAARSLSRIDKWAETLTCPIIRIDGRKDWHRNAARIAEDFCKRHGLS